MKKEYRPRIADSMLKEKLEIKGAVLIEGAKWCGKTTTGLENANSEIFLQDPDKREGYLQAADTKPSLLLQGDVPKLLDEWQTVPVLWDSVRFAVDMRGEAGQFILTGSSVPIDNQVLHTGTGRITRMKMRTMSLYESGESNGKVSLEELFAGNLDINETSNLTIEEIAMVIVRGGWPESIDKNEKQAQKIAIDYVEAVINKDVSEVDGVQKNPARVRMILKSLARNIATISTLKTIYDDIKENDAGDEISEKTISQYLLALDRIFVVDNVEAWSPVLRSKSVIRSSSKRHFVDPSIATAVMRLSKERLFDDFKYFGFLFESLCTRDLKIYIESIDGQVFHYRDSSGLECDNVLVLNDGRWALIEIKLGSKQIEEAANHLIELREKIDTDKMKAPAFLMVVTGGEFAYRRKDGVLVVPIGCLKN